MLKRILIIDDDQSICDVIAQAYEDNFITLAASGRDNIFTLIEDFKPDVVLIEYRLYMQNGAKLCSMIKLNPETTRLPVILLSTNAPNEDIKNSFCNTFVSKPFDLWELESVIDSYCNWSVWIETHVPPPMNCLLL